MKPDYSRRPAKARGLLNHSYGTFETTSLNFHPKKLEENTKDLQDTYSHVGLLLSAAAHLPKSGGGASVSRTQLTKIDWKPNSYRQHPPRLLAQTDEDGA